jgi:hypothetical protein
MGIEFYLLEDGLPSLVNKALNFFFYKGLRLIEDFRHKPGLTIIKTTSPAPALRAGKAFFRPEPVPGLSESPEKPLFFDNKGNKTDIKPVIGIESPVQIKGQSGKFFIVHL